MADQLLDDGVKLSASIPQSMMCNDEHTHVHCCCHDDIPVVVDRIKVPCYNHDGTFARRYQYLYPITCLEAVHETTSINSRNLREMLDDMIKQTGSYQKKLASGSRDTILTRGLDDGLVGELTKIDIVDGNRRSRYHVPSEYALFKAMDHLGEDVRLLVSNEEKRALVAEENIKTSLESETARATSAERDISTELENLKKEALTINDIPDATVVTDFIPDFSNLSAITYRKSSVDLRTGDTDSIVSDAVDMLTPITSMVDEKIQAADHYDEKVDKSIFKDGYAVTSSDVMPGNNDTVFKMKTVHTPINPEEDPITKVFVMKCPDMETSVVDGENKQVFVAKIKFAPDSVIQDMISSLYS